MNAVASMVVDALLAFQGLESMRVLVLVLVGQIRRLAFFASPISGKRMPGGLSVLGKWQLQRSRSPVL